MKIILLTSGYTTIVDDDDYELVRHMRWWASRCGKQVYAQASLCGRKVFLHRLLMNAPAGQRVDHISGDPLDNRRDNLRLCSHAENLRSRPKPMGKATSQYKGVSMFHGKWRATIVKDYKQYHLGVFDTEMEAAQAYNEAAAELFGQFAWLNTLTEGFRADELVGGL